MLSSSLLVCLTPPPVFFAQGRFQLPDIMVAGKNIFNKIVDFIGPDELHGKMIEPRSVDPVTCYFTIRKGFTAFKNKLYLNYCSDFVRRAIVLRQGKVSAAAGYIDNLKFLILAEGIDYGPQIQANSWPEAQVAGERFGKSAQENPFVRGDGFYPGFKPKSGFLLTAGTVSKKENGHEMVIINRRNCLFNGYQVVM